MAQQECTPEHTNGKNIALNQFRVDRGNKLSV